MDKLRMESPDMTAQNIDRIAALFPNCVTEAADGHGGIKRAINFELLKQMLSPDVVDGDEAYEFTWVGKKAAIVEANKPIRKTLRPCVEESKNWDTTENLYIEGDNLEVLKLLQESYLGKVKMIYIDPPYNTGKTISIEMTFLLNAEDGGHRKSIMVQLPEDLDEAIRRASDAKTKDSIKKAIKFLDSIGKVHTICEIGKERILRAGDKIKSESSMTTQDLDVGFRVLKLDDTNMKDVYYAPDDYDQGMLAGLESNIKDDRTDLDLLFGCLIDWGLPLSLPYKSEQLGGCTVHTYNDGDLIACFDANIPESVVKEIAQRKPLRAVFRDSGFASSPEKINVFEIFKLYMPEDADDISKRVRVI